MTEEELISSAQEGNNNSIEILLNNHKQLVNFVVRRYFLIGGDVEDLIQEGMIGLYKAIISYKYNNGASFNSYAKTIIERQIINAIKSDNSLNNSLLNTSYGLTNQGSVNFDEEESGYIIPSEKESPENQVISSEETKELLSQIKLLLSNYELKVINLFLLGLNYSDIAKELDATPKSIDNALNRIKNKLKFLKRS